MRVLNNEVEFIKSKDYDNLIFPGGTLEEALAMSPNERFNDFKGTNIILGGIETALALESIGCNLHDMEGKQLI